MSGWKLECCYGLNDFVDGFKNSIFNVQGTSTRKKRDYAAVAISKVIALGENHFKKRFLILIKHRACDGEICCQPISAAASRHCERGM